MNKKKIIIDCDPGADDSIAIMLAVNSPELEVMGITAVAGNRSVDMCALNALKVLERYERTDIPVYKGMEKPYKNKLNSDDIYSGKDGMAETFLPYKGTMAKEQHAVDMIIDTVRQYPEAIHIVSIAPMTNIAKAIEKAPDIINKIASIVTINGGFGVRYDLEKFNSRREWNIIVDPEAAKIVFESGVKIKALGLDVTTHLTDEICENLVAHATEGLASTKFLRDALDFSVRRGLHKHALFVDSIPIAYLIDQESARFVEGQVAVELEGEYSRGRTLFDNVGNIKNGSKISVAYQFDNTYLGTLLSQRVYV